MFGGPHCRLYVHGAQLSLFRADTPGREKRGAFTAFPAPSFVYNCPVSLVGDIAQPTAPACEKLAANWHIDAMATQRLQHKVPLHSFILLYFVRGCAPILCAQACTRRRVSCGCLAGECIAVRQLSLSYSRRCNMRRPRYLRVDCCKPASGEKKVKKPARPLFHSFCPYLIYYTCGTGSDATEARNTLYYVKA